MATINWFPGHMKKTKREIEDNLKLVDAVIEIRDARIPRSSANPDIDKLCSGKPRIILLNKSDLTDYPDVEINDRRKAKLYYEFPADFKPVNYLDYVDYATKIELME